MDVLDTSLRCLNDSPTVLGKMLASDMKRSGFGCSDMNNYSSPSAEREGSNGSIVFLPQLHGREGLDGTTVSPGYAKSCNTRTRNALPALSAGVSQDAGQDTCQST